MLNQKLKVVMEKMKLKSFYKNKKNEIIKIKTSMLCVSGGFNPDIHLFTQSKGLD